MIRSAFRAVLALSLTLMVGQSVLAQGNDQLVKEVLKKLNGHATVAGTDDTKSYKILFDAYLELTKPPFEISESFNLSTIHPKMVEWPAVSGWAESNAKMAQAILKCKDKNILGLPYGREGVDARYLGASLFADVGVGGSLRSNDFPYQNAIDVIAAFATAEMYRLLEAGKVQEALDLGVASAFVVRQCCDREFRDEKLRSIMLLSAVMSNLRDAFYTHQDKISADQYAKVALLEIPFLRPDRGRLFMPEADRIVSEALLQEVFVGTSGSADPEKFTESFVELQAKESPLTRFGAAKRWRNIAEVHGSLDASMERLKLIYDDWWRRWRIDAYDSILDVDTQFELTNPIRYAAVLFSLHDVEVLFDVRNQLVAEVNGTAVAAGLCAYKKTFGTYPDQTEKAYAQFMRKRSDIDPYDKELRPFKYRQVSARQSVDTPTGRLWIEPGEGLLYSQGQDHEDQLARDHTDDGADGDLVLWPPIKALSRAQGRIE